MVISKADDQPLNSGTGASPPHLAEQGLPVGLGVGNLPALLERD